MENQPFVTNIGFEAQPIRTNRLRHCCVEQVPSWSTRWRLDRRACRLSQRDLVEPPGRLPGGSPQRGRLMHKLSIINGLAALLASVGLLGSDAVGAELEGALQYPPASVGADAQPPPPAGIVPKPLSPRRNESGVSGSSVPPKTQPFFRPAMPRRGTEAPPSNGYGGG